MDHLRLVLVTTAVVRELVSLHGYVCLNHSEVRQTSHQLTTKPSNVLGLRTEVLA